MGAGDGGSEGGAAPFHDFPGYQQGLSRMEISYFYDMLLVVFPVQKPFWERGRSF